MELHCSIRVVKAGEKGNTASAAAAYISCNKTVGFDGKTNDYTKKPGFVAGNVLLPEGAPQRWKEDPSTIWAEQDYLDYEKSTRRGPNSELYRAGDIALPLELTDEQCIKVMNEIGGLLTAKGMVVQWAIHYVVEDGVPNKHGHIMMSMRSCDSKGFGKKNREWNKYNGGLNIPEYLRPKVAAILNRELKSIGSVIEVEHESFEKRNIDRIPQRHKGRAATALEHDRKNKKGEVVRKAINTDKGKANRYIDWLNEIHAENIQEALKDSQQNGSLSHLINSALAKQDGNEAFKDWDALFAMLRDTRRCRAALKGEIKRLDKLVAKYNTLESGTDEEKVKAKDYISWVGCDPEDPSWKQVIQDMRNEARLGIAQMNVTEAFLLSSKEIYSAHNRAVYTAKKASWDEYQKARHNDGVHYCEQRLESIDSYIQHLNRSISVFDMIFKTEAWQEYRATMDDLFAQKRELEKAYAQHKADLKKYTQEHKQHAKEARKAQREEKKVIAQERRNMRHNLPNRNDNR